MNKMYWMGEPIDEMPREKLVAIIRRLAEDLEQQRKDAIKYLSMRRKP